MLGSVIAQAGALKEGEDLVREALETYRALGDAWAANEAVLGLIRVMQLQGRGEEGLPLLEETASWARGAGEKLMLQIALTNLGQGRLDVNDAGAAKVALLEAELADDLGDLSGTPAALTALAAVALAQGDPERGAMLLGAAEAARRSTGTTTWVRDWVTPERPEREPRAALGDARFQTTFANGMTLTVPDTLRLAEEV